MMTRKKRVTQVVIPNSRPSSSFASYRITAGITYGNFLVNFFSPYYIFICFHFPLPRFPYKLIRILTLPDTAFRFYDNSGVEEG